ncbi:hypothetical protein [Allonocardiopsis opalescens]|uniref:Secreted protein n=1 Tax=Allonocardiopsis opalescens TaxID=1144618 RepID=A0A2T0PS65_9ACTN|nr:hypothetical protein [Allonocardiopsis opalescens]PRX91743.1 hypothetical protein CLV72_11425 [Allonocardiopsis opalescens]
MRRTLAAAAAAAGVLAAGLFAAPAQADESAARGHRDPNVIGSIELPQRLGRTDTTPFVTGAETTDACPEGYGNFVAFRVGRGDTFVNLAPYLSAGGYDQGESVEVSATRSLDAALGADARGIYHLRVQCSDELGVLADQYFDRRIAVIGDHWVAL